MNDVFQCNICGTINSYLEEKMGREISSCLSCGSTQRFRSIIYILSEIIYQKIIPLAQMPVRSDIAVLGLSDNLIYAETLGKSLNYKNTFFHKAPRLDISNPTDEYINSSNILIAADVFEHVVPPVSKAFSGAYDILKPGGSFIFQVPYTLDEKTVEHFPNLYNFELESFVDGYILKNVNREGIVEKFTNLIFHGGPGKTLEMRLFSKNSIKKHLEQAGFTDVEFKKINSKKYGLKIKEDWSLPILARKPLSI